MNQPTSHIKIPLSKGKIILLTLGSFGFVTAAVFMGSMPSEGNLVKDILVKAFVVIAILFFGTTGLFGLTKIFDFRPGLTTNHQGILDNSSILSGQLIKWQDIIAIRPLETNGQWFVVVKVKNPDYYINNMSFFKRIGLRLNKRYFDSPIHISANGLSCNFDELMAKLYNLHAQYSNTES